MIPYKQPVKLTYDGYGIEDATGRILIPSVIYRNDNVHMKMQTEVLGYLIKIMNRVENGIDPQEPVMVRKRKK